MHIHRHNTQIAGAPFLVTLILIVIVCMAAPASASQTSPFKQFGGWWSGEGRIGIKNKSAEKIRCRATYFLSEDEHSVTQNLRCSTQNFKVEVKSEIKHKDGEISGTWRERIYNVGGDISGKVQGRGVTLFVRGDELVANMHIITKDNRQIVEIHFEGIEVIGVTLLLQKGRAARTQ